MLAVALSQIISLSLNVNITAPHSVMISGLQLNGSSFTEVEARLSSSSRWYSISIGNFGSVNIIIIEINYNY